MKIKKFLTALSGCALLALVSISVSAQVGRIEGTVVKAGTGEPIAGAEVRIERTDIKGSYPVKTDKKGVFLHAGIPYVGTYTLIFSAPECAPYFLTGVRPIGDPIKVELQSGDGRKLTLDDVKKMQSAAPAGPQKQMSAEEVKKQQAEYDKKKAEIEKQKAEFDNMKKLFEQGQQLASNKDYPGAINAYTEASKLDPEQQAIWGNLALAHYNRGVTYINESLKDMSKRDLAKQDFNDSINAIDKALALNETALSDPAKSAVAKKSKSQYLKIKADAESLLAKRLGVMEAADGAVRDYKAAAALSDSADEKKSFELKAAETYFEAGMAEQAVTAYQAILTGDPQNIEALYKLGLAYASVAKFQESADTLQKFIDNAPENDARVAEVKAVIKDLVVGNNLKAPTSDAGKRRAPAKRKP
ncbi:MAG: tetratricopeptide repeat protein [Acidobacteriota bacterium]|nr:MAG: tetratricopeptide repeat protein [Acidobacteriota bacterium]